MTLDDLKEALGENTLVYSSVKMAEMANIIPFVNVDLKMDRKSFDYYYEMNVDELVSSEMPIGELESLKKQGWSFSDDRKKLVLFLKNG